MKLWTHEHTSMRTHADPKAPLPQVVLNFCTKKIAGMLIHFIKQQVRWS